MRQLEKVHLEFKIGFGNSKYLCYFFQTSKVIDAWCRAECLEKNVDDVGMSLFVAAQNEDRQFWKIAGAPHGLRGCNTLQYGAVRYSLKSSNMFLMCINTL